MELAEVVGKRTRELLFKKNMTQYRLCKITCLNEKTISDLIKGKTKDVKMSTVFLIASAFDMDLKEFVNYDLFNRDNIDI